MQTLRDIYTHISKDPQKWSYYSDPQCIIQDTWDDDNNASAFIESYFKCAGKGKTVKNDILGDLKKITKGRAKHSISTFMLCIYFSDMFGSVFSPYAEEGLNEKYYLFLICLYHDIGYVYENKCSKQNKEILKEDGLEAVQAVYDIQYIHNREFKTFTREEIDIYFKGKLAEQNPLFGGKPDHGIVGGLMLYDRLRKQFEYSWKNKSWMSNGRRSFYCCAPNGRELHLSNSHYAAYAICADAVIAHNVFSSTLNDYLKSAEQIEHTSLLALESNPFLYLLSLADTLEPIKRGIDLEQMQIEKYEKTIHMRVNDGIATDKLMKYIAGINGLPSWIDISAYADDNGEIKITFR